MKDKLKLRGVVLGILILLLCISGMLFPREAEHQLRVPVEEINDNRPFFTEEEKTVDEFELYSQLDSLGRCGVAYAAISSETMPTESRDATIDVTPTGWVQCNYGDLVDEYGYLYNRCHLIGFQLAGENSNERNIITGTRFLNKQMLVYENKVAEYIRDNPKNHVLYRVTPFFEGSDLVASYVQIEAQSIETNDISFCVRVYNYQPGITINYQTGESHLE